jgi:hypothetical protein
MLRWSDSWVRRTGKLHVEGWVELLPKKPGDSQNTQL